MLLKQRCKSPQRPIEAVRETMLPLVVWWAALALLGTAFTPVARRIFPASFPDGGRAFAKPLALIALTYGAWLLTSAGIPHARALAVALAALLAVSAWCWRGWPTDWRSGWLREEAVFFAALCFFAAVRALQPDIQGAEKYMDFAFFNTLLRNEHFPPQDPWMSGVPINYYYFGYLLFADLTRWTAVDPAVAYNLSLAVIGAVMFTTALSLGSCLSGQAWGGIVAAVALTLIGNLDGARQLLIEHKALSAFDYWRPTRVVVNTINEFPFFSLLHGDLHPHVTALVTDVSLFGVAVAAAIGTAESATSPGNRMRLGWLALLVACLALNNPWDLPVCFTSIGLLALHRFWDDGRPLRAVLASAAVVAALVGAMVALSFPFTHHFHAQFHGIGRVHERTMLGPFLVVFGFLLLPFAVRVGRDLVSELSDDPPVRDLVYACVAFTLVALYVATQSAVLILTAALAVAGLLTLLGPERRDAGTVAIALGTTAVIAIAACEVVYLRDPYGAELHRMNTVFKLYFQAWVLLALAFPAFVAAAIEPMDRWTRRIAVGVIAIGMTASLCYPLGAIGARWNAHLSLDGMAYLDRDHPNDGPAIRRLAAAAKGIPVVLEATGDPYSYYARVSSNTGLPTILGWGNHENVWRGSDPRIEERKRDVKSLYEETDIQRLREDLARYGVHYVFVGELERSRFGADALAKFAANPERFERVIQSGSTDVFVVRDAVAGE
jgi:YYY domain-containing protein